MLLGGGAQDDDADSQSLLLQDFRGVPIFRVRLKHAKQLSMHRSRGKEEDKFKTRGLES